MTPVAMQGRAGQLDELLRSWSRLVAGRCAGHPAVITGDPGIGKSTLVTAALAALRPRPALVLAGGARVHDPAPYDWLAAVLSGRDTDALPVPPDALAWLAQHPDAPRERYAPGALLRLAVTAVRALVGSGPAVLVVEDLHALDPASLNLVAELAAAGLPALLLVTSRPPEQAVSPRLAARTLARLGGSPGALRQHLRPLDRTAVAAVLAQVYGRAAVSTELSRAVWQRTRGNPYWLTELLATAGADDPAGLGTAPLPDHLHLTGGAADVRPEPAGPGTGTTGAAGTRRPGATGGSAAAPHPGGTGVGGATELTARELQVLDCLAAGMSNKQVARSLGISVRTVAVHVSNLLRKTGSASRTEAALWAVQRQPVRDPATSAAALR